MKKHRLFASALVAAVAAGPALATEFCDWRPSQSLATATVGAGSAATFATGTTAQALGYYTLTNATTGAIMLGSTAAGTSAAGTVGIVAGTSTGIGATVGGAMAATTFAAVALVVLAGVEGGCYYFHDEVVRDPRTIFGILQDMEAHADPEAFRLNYHRDGEGRIWASQVQVLIRDGDSRLQIYELDDLYIWNGLLKYDGWVGNGIIGRVSVVIPE
ncbi:hypothetical protein Rumeso_04426 [Rubellimicrobium mesophilum DSM 19309]|uniref:Uncharacterized protein n=1 Tax=Rubellimicrobium mesophilum DSM 19309 TaxID=442562 RepID=A0A017HIC7_9RHOB|nr:hypothetical protein [Rubellimicrobium mesophilum]EYD74055.1 hypothetical protein Rumeso_04426 [Rubellimicrobium mesophilum DSM 19309]